MSYIDRGSTTKVETWKVNYSSHDDKPKELYCILNIKMMTQNTMCETEGEFNASATLYHFHNSLNTMLWLR